MKSREKIDPLRERLAAPELRQAAAALASGGPAALVGSATAALEHATAARTRFAALAEALAAGMAERDAIERYLRETVVDPAARRADLRALRRGGDGILDLAALGDRLRRLEADSERRAEAALALAHATLDAAVRSGAGTNAEVAPWLAQAPALIGLARRGGRWSRRVEALGAIERLAPHLGDASRARAVDLARALFVEPCRPWVRAAALSLWGAIAPAEALAAALEPIAARAPGDDFLLRERIVELAARGGLGDQGFAALRAAVRADPSEHVRITLARAERQPKELMLLATSDPSAKVRASALLTLTAQEQPAAPAAVLRALSDDTSPLVARIAAELLVDLGRRDWLDDAAGACEALRAASRREALPLAARTELAEAAAELEVMADPMLSAAHELLSPIVAKTAVGGKTGIKSELLAGLKDGDLGRVLAVIARRDFAAAVDRPLGSASSRRGGERDRDELLLYRGERRSLAPWRLLFELLHPSPVKRQAFVHTWGRKPAGRLRAPPGGLAELTPTRVPGERVMIPALGSSGGHLPLCDDLLSACFARAPIACFGASGETRLTPPVGLGRRLAAWGKLTVGYARFAELRQRSLASDDPAVQRAYLDAAERSLGIAIAFAPYHPGEPAPRGLRAPAPRPALDATTTIARAVLPAWLGPIADRLGSPDELARHFWAYATSPTGNRLSQLAGTTLLLTLAMFARSVRIRHAIDRARAAIPIVIGGWGTRGKSGTERLKGALFQGLGHEVLVKTTGCEAMFIHAVPDTPAREIFVYRPYDKATVWEQRDLLLLARDLGVRVFLWECMALQPDLVRLLQLQWMRDDYSTITNAYPDHEDVQGPSGYDVASTIAEFVPRGGKLLTTEQQMLPLLRLRAAERGTTVTAIAPREAELIADDLLARFPYQEHPSNIALCAGLARALGVPSAIAIAEMADNVVPDLGVLKTFAEISHRGRRLSFSNGMSANERTGALGNWQRLGLDAHDVDADPGRWIVTVVNNRGDRVPRSEAFAHFLVEDIAAHRHVLIGTNVSGLLGYIREALDAHLERSAPTAMLTGSPSERAEQVHRRVTAAFRRLAVGKLDAASVRAELAALGTVPLDAPALAEDPIEALLAPVAGETLAGIERALAAELDTVAADVAPFVAFAIAKRRLVRGVHQAVDRELERAPDAVDAAFAAAYRALWSAALLPLTDPGLSGDQVLDALALVGPPGARVRIVGVQNIKGTGLDFVYRWVSIERVQKLLSYLDSPSAEVREAALGDLMLHGDYGLLDARAALAAVLRAEASDPEAARLRYRATIEALRATVVRCEARLATRRTKSWADRAKDAVGMALDYLDATRRRGMARGLREALIAGRVSHSFAARRMQQIIARSKGAWIRSKLR